jgi:PST family polysaccharide transporter
VKKIISVTAFSGLLTLFRIGSGFIIAKAVAISTGPTGMAMLGQLQSFVASLNGFVTAPVGSGLVRYTAEHHGQGYEACAPWWRASVRWAAVLLALSSLTLIGGASWTANWLFHDSSYSWLIVAIAALLPFAAANVTIGSVLNGHQQYKKYIATGMIAVAVSTAIMLLLIHRFGLIGALLSAAAFNAVSGLVLLIASWRAPWLNLRLWLGQAEKKHLQGIGGYVFMAATSSICAPLSQIVIRNFIIGSAGWAAAGYWQAVVRISDVYLSVITLSLSTYYLPRLSSIKAKDELRDEIISVARIVVPIAGALSCLIYLGRDIIISVLFTDGFNAARSLFAAQCVGDVIKIASWIAVFPVISRGASRFYIFTEILFSGTLILVSILAIDFFGVTGAPIGYALNYLAYLLFILINLEKVFGKTTPLPG